MYNISIHFLLKYYECLSDSWTEERRILYIMYSESWAEMILSRWAIRNYPLQEISFWKSLLKESEEGGFCEKPDEPSKISESTLSIVQ